MESNSYLTNSGDQIHTLTDRLTGAVDSVFGEVDRFRDVLEANPALSPFIPVEVGRYLKKPDIQAEVTRILNPVETKLSEVIQQVSWLY